MVGRYLSRDFVSGETVCVMTHPLFGGDSRHPCVPANVLLPSILNIDPGRSSNVSGGQLEHWLTNLSAVGVHVTEHPSTIKCLK